MKLQIKAIKKRGDIDKERIILKALQHCNMRDIVILKTNCTDDERLLDEVSQKYRFPKKKIEANDIICLYTKPGDDAPSIGRKSGTLHHNFFWGLEESIWDEDPACAVIIEIGAQERSSDKKARGKSSPRQVIKSAVKFTAQPKSKRKRSRTAKSRAKATTVA